MTAFEIAINMEQDAIKFYNEAATKVKHPVGRKMFLAIAEDERRHLDMLSQIFKGIDLTIQDINPIKNIKTIFETMKSEMMQIVEATTDELEAFKVAMHMEKEGIDFYKKTKSEAVSEKEKALFDRLIKEEQQHYDIFANTYFFLSDTGNWFMWEEHSIVEGG